MSEILEFLSSSSSAPASREEHAVVRFPTEPLESSAKLPRDDERVSPLIRKLCDALNTQQIAYCHWKSNWKLERWLTGEGDLDLLVDRSDAQRFMSVIQQLGFKQAEPPSNRRVPGILNFYGFDRDSNKFIHLHVHYQIVIGDDLTKNYHLPIESFLLENTVKSNVLPVPSVELEFVLFVLRMTLKQSALDALGRAIFKPRKSSNALNQELEQLNEGADRAQVANLLPKLAPGIDHSFFDRCVQSLRIGDVVSRTGVRRELERRLRTCARKPRVSDAALKLVRRLARPAIATLNPDSTRKQFVNGGLLVAVVGGDGSGKTTTLGALTKWLSKKFLTRRFHLGKPPKSLLTYGLVVLLRVRKLITGKSSVVGSLNQPEFPGYIQLLRWVSAGRDRCRLYTKVRRFATNGGIALCDRYPLPQVQLMEGANIQRTVKPARRNRLVKKLMKMEASYYNKMMLPEVLIVLRVDPEIAVLRKTTEKERHVRLRSTEVWEKNWDDTNAYVIDASREVEEVVAEAKSIIWSKL